jgi:hypothetical protein
LSENGTKVQIIFGINIRRRKKSKKKQNNSHIVGKIARPGHSSFIYESLRGTGI